VVYYSEGTKELYKFLEPFKERKPPFIISDGFPSGYLPKPISMDINIQPEQRKEIRKIEFLPKEYFECVRNGEIPDIKKDRFKEAECSKSISIHNTINRWTNTTNVEGSLYTLQEITISEIDIYLKVISTDWKDRIVNLFKEISKTGYGRKKSIGKGQFKVASIDEITFSSIPNANGFVTLSNFCPSKDDPTEGLYKIFIKYGKLGEEFTFCGNPFKKPILMIKTGAVFKTGSSPEEFYGCMMSSNISPAKKEVVQYAYAFAVPVIYPQ
jgi:CRISPR-associated protein Csm4